MAGPGGILALDLSLTTGHAYGRLGERPVWGHWNLGRMAEGGAVYARLEDEIDDAIKIHRPRLIAYEAPLPANRQNQNNVAKLLLGLPAIVELICYRHSIPHYFQHAGEARKNVLGKAPTGPGLKGVIIDWAKSRSWDVRGQDDAADALLLLAYATVIKDTSGKVSFNRYGEAL